MSTSSFSLYLSVLTTLFFMTSCSPPQTYSTGSTKPYGTNIVDSQVVSAERSRLYEYSPWLYDIKVKVTASGPAFGLFQQSYIKLYGEFNPRSEDSWFNYNSDGWPSGYSVSAKFEEWTEYHGRVKVEVVVDDFTHPNSFKSIYTANHTLDWPDPSDEVLDE